VRDRARRVWARGRRYGAGNSAPVGAPYLPAVTGLVAAQQTEIIAQAMRILCKRICHRSGTAELSMFSGRSIMGNPKIASVAYGLAVGFILIVAFYSSPGSQVTPSVPAATDLK
jgi:hypothetical protein